MTIGYLWAGTWTQSTVGSRPCEDVAYPMTEIWNWMEKGGKDDQSPILTTFCSGLLGLPNYGWQLYEEKKTKQTKKQQQQQKNSYYSSYLEETCFSSLK